MKRRKNQPTHTPRNTDTIPNFKWMPGMLAMDDGGYAHRIVHVECWDLVYTESNGGSPCDLGLEAVDTSDPTTAACLAYLNTTNP